MISGPFVFAGGFDFLFPNSFHEEAKETVNTDSPQCLKLVLRIFLQRVSFLETPPYQGSLPEYILRRAR
jgi:hypothetical protein